MSVQTMSPTQKQIEKLVMGLRTLGLPDSDIQLHVAKIKEAVEAVGTSGSAKTILSLDSGATLQSSPGSAGVAEAEDEPRGDASSSSNGVYRSNASKTKDFTPSGRRDRQHGGSNGSAGSADAFVQLDRNDYQDDPFASTPSRGLGGRRQSTPMSHRPGRSRTSLNWRNSRSGSNASPIESSYTMKPSQRAFDESEIDSKNAQAHFPPSACVFVANLLQTEDEQHLEYAVTKVFRQFGHVFVKIRRDSKNMPFAFCQFTTDEAAERAVRDGRGSVIHGRPCRTERARANCNYYVSRLYGDDLNIGEVREVMEKYGQLEKVWFPSESEMGVYPLAKGGIFVRFKFYENGREALTALRDHDIYRVVQFNKENITPVRVSSNRDGAEQRRYLARYETDRRSIFIGNLPQDATERQVQDLFGQFGIINNLEFHRRRSIRADCELNVFAFVEYADATAVTRAVNAKNGFVLDGTHIKVAQKDSEHTRIGRRSADPAYLSSSLSASRAATLGDNSISPQYYGAPYGYMAAHPPTPMYSGGYGGYGPSPYAPAQVAFPPAGAAPYYSTGSPAYAPRSSGIDHVTAANQSPSYYQYHGYPWVGAEYYGHQAMAGYPTGPYVYPNYEAGVPQTQLTEDGTPTEQQSASQSDVASTMEAVEL